MKRIHLRIAALAIFSAGCAAGASHAEVLAIRNCTWCHGATAQGYTPAPQLAGQRQKYLERQLISFSERTRDAPFAKQYMWGAAAHLGRQETHELAVYFSGLPRQSADDGDRELVTKGEAIYQRGMPEANIAACVACHGPNAEGVGEIPRLGGLAYTYVKRRLEQWGEGYHGALELPMPHIASKLSANQIEELASYLSFVK